MVIVETSVFTRLVNELLTDEEYRRLQFHLAANPKEGRLIPGSGGLRKVRWGSGSRGKRSGTRFIYYWVVTQDRILMLTVYSKNQIANLSRDQIRLLRSIVEEEFP